MFFACEGVIIYGCVQLFIGLSCCITGACAAEAALLDITLFTAICVDAVENVLDHLLNVGLEVVGDQPAQLRGRRRNQ